jgi:hypothetical protein
MRRPETMAYLLSMMLLTAVGLFTGCLVTSCGLEMRF